MVRPVPTHVPKLLWPLLRHPTRRSLLWITTGLLPARAREILQLNWSRADTATLAALAAPIRRAWPLLPEQARYHPRAQAAFKRTRDSA